MTAESHRRTRLATVEPTGDLRVDFGREEGDPVLTGIVRTASGKTVAGPATLFVSRAGESDSVHTTIDEQGRFSLRVPVGNHWIRLRLRGRRAPPSRPLRKEPLALQTDTSVDLVLPGVRLEGQVRAAAGLDALSVGNRIHWRKVGETHGAGDSVAIAADGTFLADGVQPGRYAVSGYPLALVGLDGLPATFEVPDEGAKDVRLELEVRRP